MSEANEEPVVRAHNHQPHRPTCAERFVRTGGRLYTRGECLNDDGSDR